MTPLIIKATDTSPEIKFDPDNHHFTITGLSRPEDVRAFYYPVLEWCQTFRNQEMDTENISFTKDNPLVVRINLKYFNSSSAKFLFDIFTEISGLCKKGHTVDIYWHYDPGDEDMLEAGKEMSEIAEIPFRYIEN